jgi:paraquat-inducible protein B
MNDSDEPQKQLPKANVEKSWAFTWFWIFPLLALGFIGWLIYSNFIATGPTITIYFRDAKGLEEGKSPVKFRGAEVGQVKKLTLTTNEQMVAVEVSLRKSAENLARAGSDFWIVEAELSAGQIRGLRTVVSGDYISVRPGNGAETNQFNGLPDRPVLIHDTPGFQLKLWTDKLGSLKRGSPVYYRDLQVGDVLSDQISPDGSAFQVSIWIDERYRSFVGTNSMFWHAGGVDMQLGLHGVNIKAETPKALLEGAVAFSTPGGAKGTFTNYTFQLYENPLAEWTRYSETNAAGTRIQIHFEKARGLSSGADVRFRDVKIGSVVQVNLNPQNSGVDVLADIQKSAPFFARENSQFWIVHPEISAGNVQGLQTIVSGDFLEVLPGEGKARFDFAGLEEAPALQTKKTGTKIILLSDKLGSIQIGSAVFYRGLKVGEILKFQLGKQSQDVEITAQIENRYAPLVRKNSKFYNVGGINVEIGVLSADIRAQSLKTLISGGVAFVTPDMPGDLAPNGTAFRLYEKPDDAWLGWSPKIQLDESP